MAEALILLVLGKIGSMVAEEAIESLYSKFEKEVSLLLEVEGRLKQIASEFRVIKAFLSQTETIERKNSALEAWLQGVREVAHEVEDILDEYAYIKGELCIKSTQCFKRMLHKSKSVVSWHRIANQLKEIETRLQKISEMRLRYNIKFQGENSSNIVSKRQESTALSSYLIDQDELVGIGEEKEKLIMWLKDDETMYPSIITVWGMEGFPIHCLVSVPTGIEFLTSLKVLWVCFPPDELVERINKADSSKVSHIPTIYHVYRSKTSNRWIHTNLAQRLSTSTKVEDNTKVRLASSGIGGWLSDLSRFT